MIQLELEKNHSKVNTWRILSANKAVTVGVGDGDKKKNQGGGGMLNGKRDKG